jgi:hypothetical protein
VKGSTNIGVEQTEGRKMQLIEPDERQAFLATRSEFELLETDMTDPKGDENVICSAMPTR